MWERQTYPTCERGSGAVQTRFNSAASGTVLTRDFRETVAARAARDPAFKAALLQEALQAFVEGDVAASIILIDDRLRRIQAHQQSDAERDARGRLIEIDI